MILVLVESRVHGSKADDIVRQSRFDKVEKVEAQGFAEGLWLFWNTAEVNLEIIEANDHSITSIVRRPGDAIWILIAAYASPHVDTRKHLWDHITRMEPHVLGPWVIADDMNVVINRTEKTGGSPVDYNKCKAFVECIDKYSLIDLKFVGTPYTWAKGGNSQLRERLDRALCNEKWRLEFPTTLVSHLPRIGSDHSPLLLSLANTRTARRHNDFFRFQTAWFMHPNFKEMIAHHWVENRRLGRPAQISHTRDAAFTWN